MQVLEDVKQISHDVVHSHNARGFAIVKLTPTASGPVGVLLNTTKEPLVVDRKDLRAKGDVRRFLWELSKADRIRRKDRTYVWSRWVPEEGRSVMGLATMVKREVAEKMARLDDSYQWIEVGQ